MDLTFTELDTYYDKLNITTNTLDNTFYNDNQKHNHNHNSDNNIIVSKTPQYNPLKRQTQNSSYNSKKKQVSYDDILSSMNTVVIDGKLEFIRNDKLQNIVENQPQQKKVTINGLQSQSKSPSQNNYQSQINKSSYIYNKFFKNYKEPSEQLQNEEHHRPLTKKELIKQLIINKANAINERNRIAEIKSTKLLFNNNNNRNIIINSRNILNSNGMNHLFNFK